MNATKERQAWCCLQVKLCDPCLSALYVPWYEKALYKYSSFPFLSLQSTRTVKSIGETSRLRRDVDVVDHHSSSAAVVGEVGETKNGHGDVAKFAVDEPDRSD